MVIVIIGVIDKEDINMTWWMMVLILVMHLLIGSTVAAVMDLDDDVDIFGVTIAWPMVVFILIFLLCAKISAVVARFIRRCGRAIGGSKKGKKGNKNEHTENRFT